jgi:acetylornithine/succinyldiaminopimelate/putrescine aminotransferase/predicted amino acid dehydrogenase
MTDADLQNDYARSARPRLMRRLRACRLDRVYSRAEGDWLVTRTQDGREVKVLDAVGGFGVGLLGHYHPDIVQALQRALDSRIPFHAQASARGPAGQLCRRLSEVVGAYTGRRYVVTLANSGAEAVEAAIKHAELERRAKLDAIVEGCRQRHSSIQEKLRNRECDLVPRLLDQAGERLGLGTSPDVEEIFHHVLAHNLRLVEARPLFLALEGAFHGKTTGAVQLTYEPDYRAPFRSLGIDVRFLPKDDLGALDAVVRESTIRFLDLTIGPDGVVTIEERPFVNIAALIVEPIQGEGGVKPLGKQWLESASEVARAHGFPVILDEIQSGCGRTGTFLASEQDEVIGDYYLLSKALGGGLTKVSALLVDSARYREQFGYVHSSTFAEDDLSSAVALAALQHLADPAFLAGVRERGARLRAGLDELRRAFPTVIKEVRGRGLMLGLELASCEEAESPTFRVLSEQGLLGFMVAGYLLNVCRVRVLPTLSQPDTLRLQLSGLLGQEELDHLLSGLERVCRTLADSRGDDLIAFLTDDAEWPAPNTTRARKRALPSGMGPVGTRPARRQKVPPYAGRVAFMGHFIRPGHLGLWDPALQRFDEAALETYLARVHRTLDPFVNDTVNIGSITGERVQLSAIAIPLTPRLIERGFEEGNVRWIEEKIVDGIAIARRQGASIVGLGGHLSILTGQGKRLSEDRIALTSGNAMTVAMGVQALFDTAREEGIDAGAATLGAVGATGNICSLFAQLAADLVPRIVLIGRRGMESRLRAVAEEVYFEVYKTLKRAPDKPVAGITKRVAESEAWRWLLQNEAGVGRIGPALFARLALELGEAAPIAIRDDASALVDCDLIVSASSAREAVIFPEHLGKGARVICDLAVPEDTSPRVFAERPDVKVIRGGIVQLPVDRELQLPGLPLEPGCVFACLAETLLLGLSRISEHFSYGRLTRSHVEAIRDLGRYHGFKLLRPSMTSVL